MSDYPFVNPQMSALIEAARTYRDAALARKQRKAEAAQLRKRLSELDPEMLDDEVGEASTALLAAAKALP